MISSVKKIAEWLGVDIKRMSPLSNFDAQLASIAKVQHIDVIFDVGANIGQFASQMIGHGYAGRIVSFEALTAAHKILLQESQKSTNWLVHERCALGAKSAKMNINIAGNLASSSILPMGQAHIDAAPYTKYVGQEEVSIVPLDSVAQAYFKSNENTMLKIDTQGFELEVLLGSQALLSRVKSIVLELSLVELYGKQPLWTELIDWLDERGFKIFAISQSFVDPSDFKTLSVDGVFVRK
jgi:FkbM family methyltransferase